MQRSRRGISNAMSQRPGSLLPVLEVMTKHGLNLTHMESQLHQVPAGSAPRWKRRTHETETKRSPQNVQCTTLVFVFGLEFSRRRTAVRMVPEAGDGANAGSGLQCV